MAIGTISKKEARKKARAYQNPDPKRAGKEKKTKIRKERREAKQAEEQLLAPQIHIDSPQHEGDYTVNAAIVAERWKKWEKR